MKQLSLEIKEKFLTSTTMGNFISLLNKKEKKLYISESILTDDEEDTCLEAILNSAMGVDDYGYNVFGINLSIRECEAVRRYCLQLLKNKNKLEELKKIIKGNFMDILYK